MPQTIPVLTAEAVPLRRTLLAASGLLRWSAQSSGAGGVPWHETLTGSAGVRAAIRRLGAVQLDPVAVLQRNHHMVLGNRVQNYQTTHLEALYTNQEIFEYLTHARCVMERVAWPLFTGERAFWQSRLRRSGPNLKKAAKYVRNRLLEAGPLPSRAIDSGHRMVGYWDQGNPGTKATSQALEQLWEAGVVEVAFRKDDERYFKLAGPAPGSRCGSAKQRRALHLRYIRAHGLVDPADPHFGWDRLAAADRYTLAEQLIREKHLLRVSLKGVRRSYYLDPALLPLYEQLVQAEVAPDIYLLPPLDNLLWRRERLSDIFGFEYRWEIYVPQKKRSFGPYTMPVLEGDRLIGRLDARFQRKPARLIVNGWWPEPGIEDSLAHLGEALSDLANRIGAKQVDWARKL